MSNNKVTSGSQGNNKKTTNDSQMGAVTKLWRTLWLVNSTCDSNAEYTQTGDRSEIGKRLSSLLTKTGTRVCLKKSFFIIFSFC